MYSVIPLSPSRSRRVAAAIGRRSASAAALTGSVIDRLPPWSWPMMVAAAASPSLSWALRRLLDASEDALGIVALCALLLTSWHSRRRFGRPARAAMLVPAALMVASANLPLSAIPDAVRALIVTGAIVLALAAIADDDEPIAPYAGFALLALPLLSSLEVHAGVPLRWITAEAGRWLLTALGDEMLRTGIDVAIDAGRSALDVSAEGLQMAWVGLFAACLGGWMFSLSSRALIARLPLPAVAVLAGSAVRYALLVAADTRGIEMTDAMQAAVGVGAFAAVFAAVVVLCADARTRRGSPSGAGRTDPAARPLRACRP